MKAFTRYLFTICTTTYIGVFFLRFYHFAFIYRKPSLIILGCVPIIFIALFLIAICSFVQWPILKRFEMIIAKGKSSQKSLTQKDIDDCMNSYKHYDIVIIVAHVMGFLVGAGATPFINALKGIAPFNPLAFILIEMQSVGVGFMCYTVNNVLVKRLYMTQCMREIGIKLSDNLTRVQNIAVAASIYVSAMNMITVPFNLMLHPVENGFSVFLRYSIISLILNFFFCAAVYINISMRIQDTEKRVSGRLRAETETLAKATKESSENCQNQSAAVKEIVATMHDSTELASNIGDKIKHVTSLAEKSRDAVMSGSEALQNNVKELLDIKNTNMLTIEGIKELSKKISGIWDIVSIINNVADQTKIIAFNAELEASSSGEAGKNFHIVATEIRRLSDNIIDSIKEIRDIINEIQRASDTLILDSEKGTRQIDSGCESARSLENGFESILASSKATADSSHEIIDYVGQLTYSSEQIFIALKQIAFGIEHFSENTSNISSASENVKEIASLL